MRRPRYHREMAEQDATMVDPSVVSCTALGYALRRSEHTVRRQMHLQAWHLRQLVSAAPARQR